MGSRISNQQDGSRLVGKIIWMLQHRPGQLFRAGRGFVLFHWARFMRRVWALEGVEIADSVRLQRNSSLMAEAPYASISIGAHSIIYEDARIEAYAKGKIAIGECSIVGDAHIVSRYRIEIGARFLSSWNVFIQDFDPHPTKQELRRQQVENMVHNFRPRFGELLRVSDPLKWEFPGEDVSIGDDVWVGAGATILKGAHIGSGCIVATGAVVLRGNYPAQSLLAGNPATVVKSLRDDLRHVDRAMN